MDDEDDTSSNSSQFFSFDQILYSKITTYFRNQRISRQNRRSLFKDFNYLFNLVSINCSTPPQFLSKVGIIIISHEVIGIHKKKLSSLFQYSSQGLINSILRHKWASMTLDTASTYFDVKSIPKFKTWRFYKIPANDNISKILHDVPSLYIKKDTDIFGTRQNTSDILKLMCQCETLILSTKDK